jgi:hypothetical protein
MDEPSSDVANLASGNKDAFDRAKGRLEKSVID